MDLVLYEPSETHKTSPQTEQSDNPKKQNNQHKTGKK